MKDFLLSLVAIGAIGAGLVMADVKTDYDHAADFKNFHTYSWLKVDAGDSLWSDRIRSAVDSQMSAKGFTLQPSGGDMSVAAMGRTKEQQNYTTFYDGIGGGWGWRRFGMGEGLATTSVENVPVGTLTVDVFDSGSKKLVWRATSTETLSKNADKNSKKLDKDIADMFKKFPPKGES